MSYMMSIALELKIQLMEAEDDVVNSFNESHSFPEHKKNKGKLYEKNGTDKCPINFPSVNRGSSWVELQVHDCILQSKHGTYSVKLQNRYSVRKTKKWVYTIQLTLFMQEKLKRRRNVTKACHRLATEARPWALCEIFAAACRQIIIPTSSTMEMTCHM
ncbi:hypothetical protein QQP08_009529 [Theobroma cacao]|nr:hypothetical protein QQP08_009529 [Theobroma cacao]